MNRRNFLESSAALGLLSILPISCESTESRFKMGYQLFSIRDEMTKNPMDTIKALKMMGYGDFEHYGFDAEKETMYGLEPAEFKRRLDDLELTVNSGHYSFSKFLFEPEAKLMKFVDQCIDCAHAIGSRFITFPWLSPEQRNPEGFRRTAEVLNLIAEPITKSGLVLAYHNHGFEFEKIDGVSGYDIITTQTDPELVKLQLDMYWVMHSSESTPAELINKFPGRYVMWHIKDMHKESRDYTELGNGSIDYKKLLPDADISGLQSYYIEQGGNFSINSLKSAETSARYFKDNLQKLI